MLHYIRAVVSSWYCGSLLHCIRDWLSQRVYFVWKHPTECLQGLGIAFCTRVHFVFKCVGAWFVRKLYLKFCKTSVRPSFYCWIVSNANSSNSLYSSYGSLLSDFIEHILLPHFLVWYSRDWLLLLFCTVRAQTCLPLFSCLLVHIFAQWFFFCKPNMRDIFFLGWIGCFQIAYIGFALLHLSSGCLPPESRSVASCGSRKLRVFDYYLELPEASALYLSLVAASVIQGASFRLWFILWAVLRFPGCLWTRL